MDCQLPHFALLGGPHAFGCGGAIVAHLLVVMRHRVLSFHSFCTAFTSCLILITIADNVNVKFGGVCVLMTLLNK